MPKNTYGILIYTFFLKGLISITPLLNASGCQQLATLTSATSAALETPPLPLDTSPSTPVSPSIPISSPIPMLWMNSSSLYVAVVLSIALVIGGIWGYRKMWR